MEAMQIHNADLIDYTLSSLTHYPFHFLYICSFRKVVRNKNFCESLITILRKNLNKQALCTYVLTFGQTKNNKIDR